LNSIRFKIYFDLLQNNFQDLAAIQCVCANYGPNKTGQGSIKMSPRSKAILGAALAAAMIAILGAASAAGSERVLYVAIGSQARPPIGWVEFCNEFPRECTPGSTEPRDVVLTATA